MELFQLIKQGEYMEKEKSNNEVSQNFIDIKNAPTRCNLSEHSEL